MYGNQPLQNKLGVRLPTVTSPRPHKKRVLCALGTAFFNQGRCIDAVASLIIYIRQSA